ncbi:hypothetical protein OAE71_02760 [Synechococcus sp. AH-551-A21]|nr:hypothetical protein [Synechococcus sp. AH-551-A21]MDB4678061.1 hypothetical protein [Synechococcus sp. AH-551-A21]
MKTISRCARGVKQPYGASFSTEQRAGNGLFKGMPPRLRSFLKPGRRAKARNLYLSYGML